MGDSVSRDGNRPIHDHAHPIAFHDSHYHIRSRFLQPAKLISGPGPHALAGEKYAAALEIKLDLHVALNNWGNNLLMQSKASSGERSNLLLDKAREILLGAEEIQPGSGAYNLACISALQDDTEACRHWLEVSRDSGKIPDRRHLEEDEDLDGIRGLPWFKEFLDSLEAPEPSSPS